MNFGAPKLFIAIVSLSCVGCFASYYNSQATKRLKTEMLHEEFEKIADEAYPPLVDHLGRNDLIRQSRELTDELKAIDPELNWQPSSFRPDPSAGLNDTNFTAVDIFGPSGKVTLTIDWMDNFRMCGIGIIKDNNDPGHGFRVCD